jgi:hypothetical protein
MNFLLHHRRLLACHSGAAFSNRSQPARSPADLRLPESVNPVVRPWGQ